MTIGRNAEKDPSGKKGLYLAFFVLRFCHITDVRYGTPRWDASPKVAPFRVPSLTKQLQRDAGFAYRVQARSHNTCQRPWLFQT